MLKFFLKKIKQLGQLNTFIFQLVLYLFVQLFKMFIFFPVGQCLWWSVSYTHDRQSRTVPELHIQTGSV